MFINRVVIGKIGTLVNGVLITSDHAKGIGKGGNVVVKVKSVQAVDGSFLWIFINSNEGKGEKNTTLSMVLGVFVCLLFLLLK